MMVMTSYDVKALFTSVPVDPSINTVKDKFLQDPTLPKRTNMSFQKIITLLEFCLKNSYFLFQVSVANRSIMLPWVPQSAPSLPPCLWNILRSRPLALPHTPHLWEMWGIQKAEHSKQLLQHVNTQDPDIKFTMEELDQEGSLPFLDTLVSPGPRNTLTTTVYRKPTHTD